MKIRCDSWASKLTETQAWELYDKACRCKWFVAAKWAKEEFDLERVPSKTSFYAWKETMAKDEHSHRIDQALVAQMRQREIAQKYAITDEEQIKALMSAATDAAIITGNAKLTGDLVEIAMAIKDRQQRAEELRIEERKIAIKEEDLQIAKKRLEIYEAKEKKSAEVVKNNKLTPEEKERKIKEIFGLQ